MEKQLTIFMYFIYGLSFYSMGMSSMFQYFRQSNFLFRKSLFFLALFGIIHGLTEWLIMFNRSQLFSQFEVLLFFSIMILYGISFFALMYFAYFLIDENGKYFKSFNIITGLLIGLWFLSILVVHHLNDWSFMNVQDELRLLTRYITAIPAGGMTVYALIVYARKILASGLSQLAWLLNLLAITFFFYTIFTGLIAETFSFFPANILNSANFLKLVGIPIEIFRIISAIIITVIMFMIIADFQKESEVKRRSSHTAAIRAIERRRMGSQLHDVVLQKLFSMGMTIDSMIPKYSDQHQEQLREVEDTTNQIMEDIRNFLRSPIIQHVDIDDFYAELTMLLEPFKSQIETLHFDFNIPLILSGSLDSSRLQDIIYIIREFVLNTIKHAKATRLDIEISSNRELIFITLRDNGIGFDLTEVDQQQHFGISGIKSRVARSQGEIIYSNLKKGTQCKIKIPWSGGSINE